MFNFSEIFDSIQIDKIISTFKVKLDEIAKEYKLRYKITPKQVEDNYQVFVLLDNGKGKCKTFNTVPIPIYQIQRELNKLLFQIELVKEYFK